LLLKEPKHNTELEKQNYTSITFYDGSKLI